MEQENIILRVKKVKIDSRLENGEKIGDRQTARVNEYFFSEICSKNN
jgi:hypothetical protein